MNKIDQFWRAVWKEDVEAIKILIEEGLDVNTKNDDDVTLLHRVVTDKQVKIASLLINVPNIDINAKNYYGQTALHLACEFNSASIVKLLINSPKIDLHTKDDFGSTALHYAAKGLRLSIVNALIRAGVDINDTDRQGKTALHCVAYGIYCTILCKANGKDASFCDFQINKSIKIFNSLIEAGSNVNAINFEGKTALHYLVKAYNYDTSVINSIKILRNSRNCKYIEDNDGKTPKLLLHKDKQSEATTLFSASPLSLYKLCFFALTNEIIIKNINDMPSFLKNELYERGFLTRALNRSWVGLSFPPQKIKVVEDKNEVVEQPFLTI